MVAVFLLLTVQSVLLQPFQFRAPTVPSQQAPLHSPGVLQEQVLPLLLFRPVPVQWIHQLFLPSYFLQSLQFVNQTRLLLLFHPEQKKEVSLQPTRLQFLYLQPPSIYPDPKKENGLFTNSRNSLSGRKENL